MIIHKYTLAPLDEEDPQPIIEWKAGEARRSTWLAATAV